MGEVTTIGLDLAKSIFQAHGADAAGEVVFRKKLRRDQVLSFFASQPMCVVAMEACSGAHHWAREFMALGHEVRLIQPRYVKPFVKRQKNDVADAEAIAEAAQRPTMRFVAPKTAEAQGAAIIFRTRDLLVRQRTQLSNALRGHLAEFGFVVPQGVGQVGRLIELAVDPETDVPAQARPILAIIAESVQALQAKIATLDREIKARAKADPVARRLMTIPGVGPVVATAIVALAPQASTFRRGRDFAAWVGLTPRQNSSGGKERLGRIEDGRPQPAAASDPGSELSGKGRREGPGTGQPVAGRHAVAQAAHAGHRGAGQQDREDRLVANGARRLVQSSGRSSLIAATV